MSTRIAHQFPSPYGLFSLLIIFQASTILSTIINTLAQQMSFQVELEHIGSRSNLTKMQIIQRSIMLGGLTTPAIAPSSATNFRSPVHQSKGEFIMSISLGTPPREFAAIMDTGSSIIWTQCMPCKSCYAQPTPIFDPNTSSSFSPLPCSSLLCAGKSRFCDSRFCDSSFCKYRTAYADGSSTEGYLGTETFTLGDSIRNVSLQDIAFGCGNSNHGTGLDIVAGIVGLGRGSLSLVSQVNPKRFSYCLPTLGENKKGTLTFGSLADEATNATTIAKDTPLLTNTVLPSLFYVSLEGISLDDILLPIPKSVFEMKMDGSDGTIIDSGTALTFLVDEAYQVLKSELATRVRLPILFNPFTGMDLCFKTPAGRPSSSIGFPKLKFHFTDMVLEFPQENYMVEIGAEMVCLGMLSSPGASIFGSLLQQNFLVVHDLEKQRLSFFPTQC